MSVNNDTRLVGNVMAWHRVCWCAKWLDCHGGSDRPCEFRICSQISMRSSTRVCFIRTGSSLVMTPLIRPPHARSRSADLVYTHVYRSHPWPILWLVFNDIISFRGARFKSRPGYRMSWFRASWFSTVPLGKYRDNTLIRPRPLPSLSLPIHLLPYPQRIIPVIFHLCARRKECVLIGEVVSICMFVPSVRMFHLRNYLTNFESILKYYSLQLVMKLKSDFYRFSK
jgi:hypothetical protein